MTSDSRYSYETLVNMEDIYVSSGFIYVFWQVITTQCLCDGFVLLGGNKTLSSSAKVYAKPRRTAKSCRKARTKWREMSGSGEKFGTSAYYLLGSVLHVCWYFWLNCGVLRGGVLLGCV